MRRATDRQVPRPLRCVIFDLDGTLVDSRADIVDSVNLALGRHGLPELKSEQVSEFVGGGARFLVEGCLRAAGGDARDLDGMARLYAEIYRERHLLKSSLYPGALDLLHELGARGVRVAVVSNKPYEFTDSLLRHLGASPFIQVVYGGDSLPVRKPHPGPFYAALKSCGATPVEGLIVGDGEHDMAAAREGNIYAVGATYGFRTGAVLLEHGADVLIDSLPELYELLPPS